jgi:hypothetical protein
MTIQARPDPDQPGVIRLTDRTHLVADIYEAEFTELLTNHERNQWNNRHREFNLPLQRIREVSTKFYYKFTR